MIVYPNIEPVAFSIFGWPVHWYGLMYMAAFSIAMVMGRRLLRRPAFADLQTLQADDMILAGIIGVLGGGRLGYVLFYNPTFYIEHPLQIFSVWDGGMSFHGGLLGVIFALFVFAKRGGFSFWRVIDVAAVLTPIGLGLGRIGNFINGELPGRVASDNLPWGMQFPGIDEFVRHPSSLYQAMLEGGVLALFMWFLARSRRPPGFLGACFLIGYASCRLFSEQFREPDSHLGLLIGGFSMGQLLSFPMIVLGGIILLRPRWLTLNIFDSLRFNIRLPNLSMPSFRLPKFKVSLKNIFKNNKQAPASTQEAPKKRSKRNKYR
ncbi:MAG: prolipoprotein diacylglyceryl transferase [Gammaproteobacteria bacterium WSBS_2016_MAG_OTU1]